MRQHLLLSTLVGLVLAAGVASAEQPKPPPRPPPPPSPYPMSSDQFRSRMDKMIDQMRAACAKVNECPKEYVENGINQMKFRTLDACRDGVVTAQEARWVLQAKPTVPMPRPNPRPGPGPQDDDE